MALLCRTVSPVEYGTGGEFAKAIYLRFLGLILGCSQ